MNLQEELYDYVFQVPKDEFVAWQKWIKQCEYRIYLDNFFLDWRILFGNCPCRQLFCKLLFPTTFNKLSLWIIFQMRQTVGEDNFLENVFVDHLSQILQFLVPNNFFAKYMAWHEITILVKPMPVQHFRISIDIFWRLRRGVRSGVQLVLTDTLLYKWY